MKQLLYILIFILIYLQSFSQHKEEGGVNLPKYYRDKMHFGFALAYNKTDFKIHTIKNSALPDTVIGGVTYGMKTIYTKSDPGFALGIISDFRLHEYIRLRFTPNISFASRSLEYTLQNANRDSTKTYKKSVESTFIILPLELKLQSKVTKPILININNLVGKIYVQPNFVYGIYFPAEDSSANHQEGTETTVDISVYGKDSTELNALIIDFNTQYNNLFLNSTDKYLSPSKLNTMLDTFLIATKKRYEHIKNPYFKNYLVPVWPNPPSPLTVEVSSLHGIKSARAIGARTIWAMRIPGAITNSSLP